MHRRDHNYIMKYPWGGSSWDAQKRGEIHHERATNILNTIAKLNSNKAHIDSFLSSNYFHKLIQEKVTVESIMLRRFILYNP